MGTLGADINVAEWVLTGYMLSMASILPAAGWLSERFGYKKNFLSFFDDLHVSRHPRKQSEIGFQFLFTFYPVD